MSSRPSRGAARLAAILDALPDALVLVNANGTVVNANAIALEAFETPGTALVGRGLLDLLPEFDSRLIPGSMRRPESIDERGRTKPTRMTARRTDGSEFPVEVTSSNLEDIRDAYDNYGYTGDELLMLVVRDLSGAVDTEAELARSQRQTEMILRAAAEGVVGTDTDGRVVLVNPAAAQILGFRASDLGGQELHHLVLHSRADGEPFPYEESPLADTLRSGRKHRVRGQVLWSKSGDRVAVDLTTAPVRDGDQLVGAVMTFTDRRPYDALAEEHEAALAAHAEEMQAATERRTEELRAATERHAAELAAAAEQREEEIAAEQERYAALAEREKDRFEEFAEHEKARYDALAARHEQLLAVLGSSLRGPLDELRRELSALAADDAGQLWPEANQVLHHLSAGYARITTLVDNVLGFQLLDSGADRLSPVKVMLDAVVASGVEGAVELIGPGRAQFAVHAPPIEVEVDPGRLATALAHLVADVAGIDATGNARAGAAPSGMTAGGYVDSTVVVAAAQRGEVVRIEVRGPYAGGDPVHEPIVRGIVRAHGGVLQTHEVPGMSGNAYVLEVPIGAGAGAVAGAGNGAGVGAAGSSAGSSDGDGSSDASSGGSPGDPSVGSSVGSSVVVPAQASPATSGGRRRARRAAGPSVDSFLESSVAEGATSGGETSGGGTAVGGASPSGTGRRRGRRAAEADAAQTAAAQVAEAAASVAPGAPALGEGAQTSSGTGRRRGRPSAAERGVGAPEAGAVGPGGAMNSGGSVGSVVTAAEHAAGSAARGQAVPPQGVPVPAGGVAPAASGQRARRNDEQLALPPALPSGGGGQEGVAAGSSGAASGAGTAVAVAGPGGYAGDTGEASPRPTGRRRRALAAAKERAAAEEAPSGRVFALPPASADQDDTGQHEAALHHPADDHTPPQPHPAEAPTGRRRSRAAQAPGQGQPQGETPAPGQGQGQPQGQGQGQGQALGGQTPAVGGPAGNPQGTPPGGVPSQPTTYAEGTPGPGAHTPGRGVALPPENGTLGGGTQGGGTSGGGTSGGGTLGGGTLGGRAAQPLPAEAAPGDPNSTQGRAFSVRTLGQGVPFGQQIAEQQQRRLGAQQGQGQGQASAGPGGPGASGAQGAPGGPVAPGIPGTPGGGPAAPGGGPAAPGGGPAAPGNPAAPAPAGSPQSPLAPQSPLPPQAHPAQQNPQGGRQGGPQGGRQAPQSPQAPAPGQAQGQAGQAQLSAPGQAAPPAPQRPTAGPLPEQAPTQSAAQGQAQGQGQGQGPGQSLGGGSLGGSLGGSVGGSLGGSVGGSGRRRRLSTPPDPAADDRAEAAARPHPQAQAHPQSRIANSSEGTGRSYAIGAPDEDADEGPEPLDGPGGAVEVANRPQPQPMDDELPPEPLDNPRRLLVWPAPDVTTQQALSDRGYRPVIVNSREEVDAQIAAFPAALFVDPLTGPITRTALQSLRTAAVAAEVPVLVTAGLGQATREAAYGADPAVLLKALAPRDSEQHPPRVLLIEEHEEIALALTATLERRGMQVARAESDADAVTLAAQMRPNLVVMDLMQVRRRRAGIIDWLRANGRLNRTPLVVYTAAVDQTELPRLAAGETVLFLAERSTSTEVQGRIVDLLAKIGTN
ncbi:PAS domain-containing protein [Streptomyces sp. NPDC055060]